MFLDAAYVTKYYVNESDSAGVRAVIAGADNLILSGLTIVELTSAVRRHLREGRLTVQHCEMALVKFRADVEAGIWTVTPISEEFLWRVALRLRALPAATFLRAGDAIQLLGALEAGEQEIWSGDRHLLAAAPHFGLTGRTV